MAAGFAKGQNAGLGECGWGTAASGATERTVVGRGIGHIDDESVQSHGPHAAVECAGRSWLTLETNDLIGQEPQRGDAETFARLAKGRSPWGSRRGETVAASGRPGGSNRNRTGPKR